MDLTNPSNEVNILDNNERYYEGMLRMMREEDAKTAQENVMRLANRSIWVTFKKEGIHKYPAALEDPNLATGDEYDVSFLGYPHRHIFHFKVRIEVTHNDRDIEFIQFKRWLESLYTEGTIELDYKSCEMIADDLYNQIADRYPNRDVVISVAEDNENGCEIIYEKNA
mgnify:FL=1